MPQLGVRRSHAVRFPQRSVVRPSAHPSVGLRILRPTWAAIHCRACPHSNTGIGNDSIPLTPVSCKSGQPGWTIGMAGSERSGCRSRRIARPAARLLGYFLSHRASAPAAGVRKVAISSAAQSTCPQCSPSAVPNLVPSTAGTCLGLPQPFVRSPVAQAVARVAA